MSKKSIKSRKCEICGGEARLSAVIDGMYYQNVCLSCKNASLKVASGHARWKRSIDAEDHLADLVQPFLPDGSRNPEFARLYPKQAEKLFNEENV